MKTRGILTTAVILLALAFAAFNWEALTAGVPVDLLVTTLTLPVGLILLVLTLAVATVFFASALLDRASQLQQVTHLERQLETAHDKLAQRRQQEIAALEASLVERFDGLAAQLTERADRLEARVTERADQLEEKLTVRADALEERIEARGRTAEEGVRGALEAAEERLDERFEGLTERVVRVRDEIAADVGEAEDALRTLLEREPLRE